MEKVIRDKISVVPQEQKFSTWGEKDTAGSHNAGGNALLGPPPEVLKVTAASSTIDFGVCDRHLYLNKFLPRSP